MLTCFGGCGHLVEPFYSPVNFLMNLFKPLFILGDENIHCLKEGLHIHLVQFIGVLKMGKFGVRLIRLKIQYQVVDFFQGWIKLPDIVSCQDIGA